MQDLDVEMKPTKAEVNGDGSHLYITWPDGHVSPYPVTWLHERRFGDEARQRRLDLINVEYETWGNEFQDKVPTPDFMKVMEDDKELLSFLYNLDKYGLILMKNVPRKEGQVHRLAERVRFVKNTHYGKEFTVRVKDDPNNAAYTAAKLGLHVDLPFYSHAPGIQMLHCVNQAQGKGGENQFVDGFHVAEQLKRTDPESFKLMTDVCVDFYDLGEEDGRKFYKILRQPLFSKDESGERIVRINYNDQVRDTHLSIPIEKVQPLYKAIKKYNTLMYDPDNYVELKMAGGEMVVFNNVRVLHGRAGYEGAQSGGRLLYGAYIAWDEAKCRLRVLQQEYGTPTS